MAESILAVYLLRVITPAVYSAHWLDALGPKERDSVHNAPARLIDSDRAFVRARLDALHDAANDAARYVAHEAPTVRPPAPLAGPQLCVDCERAYEDCAPHRGWCASCAPDGVLIGVLCACGGERLLEGQERCQGCDEERAS